MMGNQSLRIRCNNLRGKTEIRSKWPSICSAYENNLVHASRRLFININRRWITHSSMDAVHHISSDYIRGQWWVIRVCESRKHLRMKKSPNIWKTRTYAVCTQTIQSTLISVRRLTSITWSILNVFQKISIEVYHMQMMNNKNLRIRWI